MTQTGFIGERSIFDNLFIFWESMAAARHSHESLAIILLDFEKAYDRVDWDFLHGTLLRLGFPKEWVNGVNGLRSQQCAHKWEKKSNAFHCLTL